MTGGNSNKNEDTLVARMDLEQIMAASMQTMRDEIAGIMAMIESLTGDEYAVVLRRYTLNESMEQISEVIFISVRQCWRIHETAIRRLSAPCQ